MERLPLFGPAVLAGAGDLPQAPAPFPEPDWLMIEAQKEYIKIFRYDADQQVYAFTKGARYHHKRMQRLIRFTKIESTRAKYMGDGGPSPSRLRLRRFGLKSLFFIRHVVVHRLGRGLDKMLLVHRVLEMR